jgi:hypothetical protein
VLRYISPAKVERDEFYQAISAVLELSPKSDRTFLQSRWRRESYDIIGQNLQLFLTSRVASCSALRSGAGRHDGTGGSPMREIIAAFALALIVTE